MNRLVKVIVVWLFLLSFVVCVAIGWYAYDVFEWKAEKERMARAFWIGDSIQKAQQLQWETIEKQQDEAFKDSVRHNKFNKQKESALWIIPTIPDLSSEVATLIFWIGTTIVGALAGALVYVFKQWLDILKSISPLLSEVKVFLQQNLNK